MMTSCQPLQPLHLPDCTACRIQLARERRLARMLEEDLEDLSLGEDLVRSVMATLPDGPPPRPARSERRRGLKLAVFAGLVGMLAPLLTRQLGAFGGGSGLLRLPRLEPESLEGALQGLLALARLIVVVLDRLSSWLPVPPSSLPGGPELALGVLFALLFGVAAASTLIAVAAGSLVRLAR
jgi:hypothetical protein